MDYNNLGQNGSNRTVDATVEKFFTNGVCRSYPIITLAHGRTHGHWCVCIIRMILSEFIHCHMDHTHLGCITVRNHDLCALFTSCAMIFAVLFVASFCSGNVLPSAGVPEQ